MKRYARWGFALVLLPLAACGGGKEEAPMAAASGTGSGFGTAT